MSKILFSVIFILSFVFVRAQNEEAYSILEARGEIRFSFEERKREKIDELSEIISIDKIDKSGMVFAYANRMEFEQFLKKGYPYQIFPTEKTIPTKSISMAMSTDEMRYWDKYPTYPTYLRLMEYFQSQYPDLCQIDTIGYSINGRLILSAKITEEGTTVKPNFFYSSTMHGDEVTGFVLMLRLIDYLLSNYGTDEYITQLIHSVNIYINPNANPDGTYFLSDNDVSGSKRNNSNNIDLNRNYPNPFSKGSEPTIQPENEAMINYLKNHHFAVSANLHGGAEVMNFPWDSYTSSEKRPADSLWWKRVSQQFVDTCRKHAPRSFTDIHISGITYGGNWYKIANGRQDYVNAELYLREMTMEISSSKILPSDSLNFYWEMLHRPFLNYIKQAAFGIRGTVTDSLTGQALKAKIHIANHDDSESFVYSNSENGHFFRPISAGTYNITFSADGYNSKTLKGVSIEDSLSVFLSIKLSTAGGQKNVEEQKVFKMYPNPANDFVRIECAADIKSISLITLDGKTLFDTQNINRQNTLFDTRNLRSGIYIVTIETATETLNRKLIIFK